MKILHNSIDQQAIQNFISLAKGGNVNISSLNITGDVKIGGKLNVVNETLLNGKLIANETMINCLFSVTNGSNFTGGRHYFQDEEKTGRLRVGGAWGIPGIYSEDGKDILVGNNGVKNLHMHGKELHINNSNFRIKENKIQYIPGNYELNFNKDDSWVRLYKIDTTEHRGGYASGVM